MTDKSNAKKKRLTFKQLDILSTAIVIIALTAVFMSLPFSKMSTAITLLLLFVAHAIIVLCFMLVYIKWIEPRKNEEEKQSK